MQPAVLRALEFDRIRDALAHDALTPLGRTRVLALEPLTDPEAIAASLALSGEAVSFEASGGSLGISAPSDLEAVFAGLDAVDQPLEPLLLVGLARFLDSVTQVAASVRRHGSTAPGQPPTLPGLRAIATRGAAFDDEIAAVRRAIEPSGEINDRASPALADIRESLRRLRARLRSSLEGLTRGRDASKYLQDQIVTDRNGRYVVVVRAEHRDAVPGIVHGSSTSGASLYVEPLGTVELNNDVVALVEREKQEILRILLALSNAFRLREDDLGATVDMAADLDELHAKAGLARRVDGVAPRVVSDGRLEFRGARHPLLIPAVRDALDDTPGVRRASGTVIGSDLVIVPPARALVISGPNTGGKTVALKAAGLLALMAQAGLLIPVEPGSAFTPFRTVFADIGDEQSISASLSTFSAHIANIVSMERALALPALVLLDEVGSGTDPMEGGALGIAIIDHFLGRGAIVLATTHDEALKSYAATTDRVLTGGFGFDPATYAPTYRLIYGSPGRSLAFEIAERLGMPAEVVASARTRRTDRNSLLEAHLAQIDRDLAAIASDRATLDTDRATFAAAQQTLRDREGRLAEREALLRKRMDDRLNEKLRDARLEVDRIVGQLKQKADSLAEEATRRTGTRGPVLTTGEVGDLRVEARAALGTVAGAVAGDPSIADGHDRVIDEVTIGQTVFVPTFATEGIVRAIHGKQAEVDVRGKRVQVSVASLRQASAAREQSGRPAPGRPAARPRETLGGPVPDLVVIGCTVDEAIARAEKFLDQGLLADARRLRIVHGHGTGRLRDGLTQFFRGHPLVTSVSAAPDNEGGRGALILELRD